MYWCSTHPDTAKHARNDIALWRNDTVPLSANHEQDCKGTQYSDGLVQDTDDTQFWKVTMFKFHHAYQQFPRPKLVVHAVYHQERCSRCGQLDVKYSGKLDITVHKIFLFKLFFLGFFSVSLPNIYFNILEYLSTPD